MKTETQEQAAQLFEVDSASHRNLLQWLATQSEAVLLETTRTSQVESRSLLFIKPKQVLQCETLEAVRENLHNLERALRSGYYVAGFLAYEAGYVFEKTLPTPRAGNTPLLRFGVYETPIIYDHAAQRFETGESQAEALAAQLAEMNLGEATWQECAAVPSLLEAEYAQNIARIKSYIAAGDTYQVNFTFKLKFAQRNSAAAWYQRLRRVQRVAYSAFLALPEHCILSLSPELFFRWDDRRLTLKPMKGTARRGRTLEEDEQQRLLLLQSEKNRAENLMIVDLLRNDAGRIAEAGSVEVSRFFDIEKYETVLQATSTITATVRENLTAANLLRSLFPCGSITGAPKIRTMQIIHELEKEPRGVYTGAIGYFAPQRKAVFSVAIRTVVLDKKSGAGEMGIGSGVVWDSEAEAEYHECLLKARFLTESSEDFQLIETLRWERARGFSLLHEHLQRLQNSAEYFDFYYDEASIRDALHARSRRLQQSREGAEAFRVRLTLDRAGKCRIEHAPLEVLPEVVHLGFAAERTNSQDRFLFHKTTRRALYDRTLQETQARGWFDMIFLNERGEVTEGARSNIIIKQKEEYLTPPLACGVLPGTYRAHLLASQRIPLREKVLQRDDIETAEEVWVCNAVRGLVRAFLNREQPRPSHCHFGRIFLFECKAVKYLKRFFQNDKK